MKSLTSIVVVVVMVIVTCGGCAQNRDLARVQNENAELRSRIAQLESQVAELRQAPITVNGLTLSPLEVPLELRLTPSLLKSAPRTAPGAFTQGQLMLSGTGTIEAVKTVELGSGDRVRQGTMTTSRTVSTAKSTTTTRATPTTTTPAK